MFQKSGWLYSFAAGNTLLLSGTIEAEGHDRANTVKTSHKNEEFHSKITQKWRDLYHK